MFASLLPGIRDLRVPLASGALWLFALWVLFFPFIPAQDSSNDLVRAVWVVVERVGYPASLAGVAFAAFLLGTIVGLAWPALAESTTQSFFHQVPGETLAQLREKLRFSMSGFQVDPHDGLSTLGYFVDPDLVRRHPPAGTEFGMIVDWLKEAPIRYSDSPMEEPRQRERSHDDLSPVFGWGEEVAQQQGRLVEYAARLVSQRVIESIPQIAVRLHAESKNLWDEYDRLRAESEFRLAIAPPIVLLFGASAGQLSAWHPIGTGVGFILGLGVGFLFLWSGLMKNRESNDAVLQAVLINVVKSPAQDEIERLLRPPSA